MAKRTIKEKELLEFLHAIGCKEIKEIDKTTAWYKKASKRPSCLKAVHKQKTHR